MDDSSGVKLRIIIIDDESEWRDNNRLRVERLGHRADVASDLAEAQFLIDSSKEQGDPFDVAIVDRNFMVAGRNSQEGEDIIQYLKSKHPNIIRIMLTGDSLDSEDHNHLIFDIGIDYYIEKNRINDKKLEIAFQRARQHHNALSTSTNQLNTRNNVPSADVIFPPNSAVKLSIPTTSNPDAEQRLPYLNRPEPLLVTLRFEPTKSGAKILWESFMGEFVSRFTLPYSVQQLPIVIKALDAAQYPEDSHRERQFSLEEQALLTALNLWKGGRVPSDAHRTVGRRLYDALIRDREGERALMSVRENARNQGRRLSYILRFPKEAVELASLPWESLRDERQAVLLSRGTREIDSCQRYLNINEALSPPLPIDHKLHILALSPQAGVPLEVRNTERAARLKSWDVLKAKGALEYDELSPVTMTELDNRMRCGPQPDIIHFYGHGIYKDGSGYLLFDNAELPRQREWVSADRLSAQLGGIRLIMLHACQSALVDDLENEGGLLTGIAPALSVVSEAVVAMQLTVRISAATRFSEVFYEEITRGRSLQAAVSEARRSLYAIEGDGASWYVPTLYIRTREQKPVYLVQPTSV